MHTRTLDPFIRRSQAAALVALPGLWLVMFVFHFRKIADFFVFHARYVPVPAADKVTHLIAARNQWPMIHDPHLIGYLSLPLVVLGAFGLYAVGRAVRPRLAALGLSLTVFGTIYLGGVFGLFCALTRGLGEVDPRFTDGAIATYAAVTADHGAYGLTRRLAMLALLGIAAQMLALWRASGVPNWAPPLAALGCALFLSFWDVDNMMFVGAACLLISFIPAARRIRTSE